MNENIFIFGVDTRCVSIIQRFICFRLCHDCFLLSSCPAAILSGCGCSERVILPIVEESVALGFVLFSWIVFYIVIITISICKLCFDESTVIAQVTIIQIVQIIINIVDVIVINLI